MVISPNWCGNFSSPLWHLCEKHTSPIFSTWGISKTKWSTRFGAGENKNQQHKSSFLVSIRPIFFGGKSETKTWLEWSDLWFTTPVWWPVFSPAAPFKRVSYRAGGGFLCVFGGSYSELKGEVDLGFSWNPAVVSGWWFQGAFLDYLNMKNYLNVNECCVFSRILVWMAFGKFQSDQNLKVSLI